MWRPQSLHTKEDTTLRIALRTASEVLEPGETIDGFRASHAKGFQLSREDRTLFQYGEERETYNSSYWLGLWCQIHKLGM